jgi:hypothetical protein
MTTKSLTSPHPHPDNLRPAAEELLRGGPGYEPVHGMTEASRSLPCQKPACDKGSPWRSTSRISWGIWPGATWRGLGGHQGPPQLPAVCGRVCPRKTSARAPASWAKRANRGIGLLEVSWRRLRCPFGLRGLTAGQKRPAPRRDPVACIGSGPSSLTWGYLSARGIAVTVYEARTSWRGPDSTASRIPAAQAIWAGYRGPLTKRRDLT